MGYLPAASGQPITHTLEIYKRSQPAATQPTPRVAELTAELSNDSPERRQTAAANLLETGPEILPQLQWALNQEEASIPREELELGPQQSPGKLLPHHAYRELRLLIDHLNERQHSAGSIITLHYKDAPIKEILSDFGKQADADVSLTSRYEPLDWASAARGTIDVERVSYWDALRAVQQTIKLGQAHSAPNRLTLSRQEQRGGDLPLEAKISTISGPILIVPFSVESRKTINYLTNAESTGVTLTLQAFSEPKLSTGKHAIVKIDACLDEQGKSMLSGSELTFPSIESDDQWRWTIPVQLAAPSGSARIKTIKGHFGVGVGGFNQYLMIPDILRARDQSVQFDGLILTLKYASRFPPAGYAIEVEVSVPAGNPSTRTILARENSSFSIWDESRGAIWADPLSQGFQRVDGRDIAKISIRTPAYAPVPATLAWRPPSESRWFMVPFELHDIPVPMPAEK